MKNQWLMNKIKNLQQKSARTITRSMDKKTFGQKAKTTLKVFQSWVGRQMPMEEKRKQIIASMEEDVKDCVDRGLNDAEILQPVLDSPSYQALLEYVDLNIEHIKVAIKKARKDK